MVLVYLEFIANPRKSKMLRGKAARLLHGVRAPSRIIQAFTCLMLGVK